MLIWALDGWGAGPARLGVERDARGRLLSSGPLNPRSTAGGDVLLSIDAGLQGEAEAALTRTVERFNAKGGVVIAIDPKTGDVLSLAEAPGFNPNDFRDTQYAQTRSRAFLDAIEPGSTLKAFLIAAALEAGTLDAHDLVDTEGGEMRVPGKTIRDHHDYGVIDPAGVLRYSSNVGSVKIAQALGPQAHHAALKRFGFGSHTGSGFPTESAGLLRGWKGWNPLDHATHAFGQGINVTPIQLAMACAALANGGELMQPRLVVARRKSMQAWESTQPVSLGRAMTPETAAALLPMLESVVSDDGTGRLAGLAGVRVGGKTGTAQKFDRKTGRYSQTRYTAWFMGVAPIDDPKIAIVVGLDEPTGVLHTGGSTAAPLFAEVAAAHLAHLGIVTRPEPIAPSQNPRWKVVAEAAAAAEKLARAQAPPAQTAPVPVRVASKPKITKRRAAPIVAMQVAAKPRPARSHAEMILVPNFRGGNISDAKRLAASESLDLRVLGSDNGRVSEQSPPPGSIVTVSERTILLSFSARTEEG
jgi:cell division protein FtsI (penicillin-binding protein 3)